MIVDVNESLKGIIAIAIAENASDIHLVPGKKPVIRVHGKLKEIYDYPILTETDIADMIYPMIDNRKKLQLNKQGSVDFAFQIDLFNKRFRANIFKQRVGVAAAFRILSGDIPNIYDLGFPIMSMNIIKDILKKSQGLVLVTGPTGSGKSTTLAAFIQEIIVSSPVHVITIEDPIEYVFNHGEGIVNQREVGMQTPSFAQALKDALREDPDVIMVGEMRDLETIKTALTAAETGHLVFATLHTNSAPQTISRIVDVFPPEQQQQIRIQLADTLLAVISQRLPRTKDGRRHLAVELMYNIPAIANLIRSNKIPNIHNMIELNYSKGMITMNKHLDMLIEQGIITEEEARKYRISLK